MCFIKDGVKVKLMTGGDQLDPWFEKERRNEPWLRGFPFNQSWNGWAGYSVIALIGSIRGHVRQVFRNSKVDV